MPGIAGRATHRVAPTRSYFFVDKKINPVSSVSLWQLIFDAIAGLATRGCLRLMARFVIFV